VALGCGPLWYHGAEPESNGQGAFVYNLRFPGQYYQTETGLNYNYFRDYDPQTGRYIESDPSGLGGGSASTYAYAGAAPVSKYDPLGLFAVGSPNPGINTIVCDGDDGIEPQILPIDPASAAWRNR